MKLFDNNRVTFGTKISDRIWKDSNGQLICRDCVLARTGVYDYLESEIIEGGDRNKIVKVFRTDDEVFNPTSMASFENKPFVDDHPQENVTLKNNRDLAIGYVFNIRRGTGDLINCLIGDLVVTNQNAIDEIVSGDKRELSLGYDTVIVDRGGKFYMTKIRGNHLALVDDGRAGCATIRDSAKEIKKAGGTRMLKNKSKVTLFDEDIYEIEEIGEDEKIEDPQVPATEVTEPVIKTKETDEDTSQEILALLRENNTLLKQLLEHEKTETHDEGEIGKPVEPSIEENKEELVKDEDSEEDKISEDVSEDVDGDNDEEKLLDAEKIEEEKVTAKDSNSVYKKFVAITDKKENLSDVVANSFKNRYARMAKK